MSTPPARLRSAVLVLAGHAMVDLALRPATATATPLRLLAAIVPIALVAGVAAWLPRLPLRRQAVVALGLAPIALTHGGLAVAQAVLAGPLVEGISGAAATTAGMVLVVTATRVLWSGRNRTGGITRVLVRRFATAVVAAVLAAYVVTPLVAAVAVTRFPQRHVEVGDLGAAPEDVRLVTSDGVELAGSYVPSVNGAAVLVYPGRGPSPSRRARLLVEHGYGVLLVDQRGQGESEGESMAVGWQDRHDVAAALAYLASRPDVAPGRIGGLGISVGGEALLQAAAESPILAAVVSDGAGVRSVREAAAYGGARMVLSEVPINALFTAAASVLAGVGPPPALQDLVPRIAPRPVLFIHAGRGQGGEDLNPTYFAAANEPKELWYLPEASHTGGINARPQEYEDRVVGFLDEALLATPTDESSK